MPATKSGLSYPFAAKAVIAVSHDDPSAPSICSVTVQDERHPRPHRRQPRYGPAGVSQHERDATRHRRSAVHWPQRGGANAQVLDKLLQASVPRVLRPAEIRKIKHRDDLSFTSLRHALNQLESRSAADEAGDSKTWRRRGARPNTEPYGSREAANLSQIVRGSFCDLFAFLVDVTFSDLRPAERHQRPGVFE